MNRSKTFDATGIAPNGRLFAGDLNLIQDLAAALTDLAQNLQVGSIAFGETGLLISRYGAGEFQLAGLVRMQGIARMLSGFVAGTYTTTTRNAIAPGSRPYGLVILNTTTNQYEWNSGTDAAPVWQAIAPAIGAGSIGTNELANDAVTGVKIAPGHGGADDYGTVLPTTGLFNGYKFSLFIADPVAGNLVLKCVYRADLDATRPWHTAGEPIIQYGTASVHTTAPFNSIATALTFTAPRNGIYGYSAIPSFTSNGSGPSMRLTIAGSVGGWISVVTGGRATLTSGQTIVIDHSNDYGNISLSDSTLYVVGTFYPQKIV